MAETMHVRLKVHNPKKGHVLRRYTVGGIRFQAGRGWYKVDAEMAAYLEAVHQLPEDEDSPLAFDVCTEAEARAIDAQEARAARQVLPAEEAMDVTRRRRMRVADVTRTRQDAVRAPRDMRAELPPRVRRADHADMPPQGDAPPRHQNEVGRGQESEDGPHETQTAGDEPSDEQPEDAAAPWEESTDLARDLADEGTAEESFDDGLPVDPEVPPDDEEHEEDEAAEDSSGALTTADLPEAHGRRHRRGKRR